MSETLTSAAFARAAAFIAGHGRLLERRLFEVHFADGSPGRVAAAIEAYRNADGGLGHALEPDVRTAASQPIFAHFGLTALREAGLRRWDGTAALCDALAGIADPSGAIPYVTEAALADAHAAHWNSPHGLEPLLHATAGVAAGLLALGAAHPWLAQATAWCVSAIEGTPPYSGHRMLNVLDLIQALPDPSRRAALWTHVTSRLFEADHVQLDTPVASYGLTPLHFAPTPDAPARALFDDAVVDAHLDDLVQRQEDDGGWPIFWTPPAGNATAAWRARWTLDALCTLAAYGRLA